ncbi:hypothetical protein HS7_13970 [Sulfolobales archaeon HS-7]|nr:hypothetical protein HS7_13970 [Sulfolobales archaeon HS-7]
MVISWKVIKSTRESFLAEEVREEHRQKDNIMYILKIAYNVQ